MKGQGKYIIGIFVMIAAISIGMIGQFAIEYVLANAFAAMNENYARYDSMTHSYMVLNDGYNNVGNHSEFNDEFDTSECAFTSSDIPVESSNDERYRIAFETASGSGYFNFDDGSCTYSEDHIFEEPKYSSVPLITAATFNAVFPRMAYWSEGDGSGTGKSFYMHTRVTPERVN